ncbi:MAG: hypothetical protein REI93_13680, partial [Pedobacter sp.]|nr:hypothetical protein [Pedobacter sp.]
MKSSLTFLIGMALATTVHAQITVSHADSVHLGTVLGTGGNGFYGRNYLKNLTQGQASDSILVANADGLIRLVKRSTLAAPLTLQGVTNLGNSTTNNMGIGGSALTGGTSAHWLTVNGSVYSGGIIYAEGNAAKAYHYVDTDHMLAHQATSGIGQKFLVNGSNAPGMVLTTSGSVGIGTSDPDSKLTIRGDNPTVDIQANADHQKPGIFMRYQNNTYSGAQIYYQTID